MMNATPVVIGVGDVKNKSTELKDALEPLNLILQAIEAALQDTGLDNAGAKKLQSDVDSIDCVATWTWPYPNLPELLAQRLGVQPGHKHYTDHGGNQPAKLLDEAARRISLGKTKVALITGGEALASLGAYAAAGKMPPPDWTKLEESVHSVFTPSLTRMTKSDSLGTIHGVGLPIQVYPMYENAYRAARGQSIKDNHKESTQLYAHFASVAAQNPLAWNYGQPAVSEDEIGTVTKKNRMICFPYPLLMNAFNTVNLAATCILTSAEYATELGVPKSKWIYPLGGAGTREHTDFWNRPYYHSSPAISRSIDAALLVSGISGNQVDLFDLYSCFPIVPKIACKHLGISITKPSKPITLLGGLTSFGGAGNNYSMHAITEMVRYLRQGVGSTGLILANGGCLTYQHVVCLSTDPRKDATYPPAAPLSEVNEDLPIPRVEEVASGEATVETYTVDFSRSGSPVQGHIVGRLGASGKRFIANNADTSTLQQLCSKQIEPIGRAGWVRNDPESRRNLFTFERPSRL
jgi:acetyl-CoA acetyltransferase